MTSRSREPTELDRSALAALICGGLSVFLSCVPLLGAILGLSAVVLFLRSRSKRRKSLGLLHGGGLATIGVILGGLGGSFGLLVSLFTAAKLIELKKRFDAPAVITAHNRTATFEQGGQFVLARSGETWGVLWTEKRDIDTGRMDLTIYCRERVYFTLLDDGLVPKLGEQHQILERPCPTLAKYNLHALPQGFAVTYVLDDELRVELFDAAGTKLGEHAPLLDSGAGQILTTDAFDHTIATFPRDSEIVVAVWADGVVRTLSGRPGNQATPLHEVALPSGKHADHFSGSFARPSLLAWTQSASPDVTEVAYALSLDGRRIDRQGTIRLSVPRSFNRDLAVLRLASELSVVIHSGDEIWQHRFGLDGANIDGPELLARDPQGVYNFNADSTDAGCFILYTAGNFDLKSYACRTKKIAPIGDHYAISMGCAGSQCLYSTGSVVRWLDPTK